MPSKNPAREKRLAAALRQNLRRRKEADRARAKSAEKDAAAKRNNPPCDSREDAAKPD
jgi:hypothetical protein